MKNKRFYTLFRLENGDEIPLSFRKEKELKMFMDEHPTYILVKRSNKPFQFEGKDDEIRPHDLRRLIELFDEKYGELGYAD